MTYLVSGTTSSDICSDLNKSLESSLLFCVCANMLSDCKQSDVTAVLVLFDSIEIFLNRQYYHKKPDDS